METWLIALQTVAVVACVTLCLILRDYYGGDLKVPPGKTKVDARNSGKRVLAIVNPVGGRRRALRVWSTMEKHLEDGGLRCTLGETKHSNHARQMATEAAKKGDVDVILCVGGDGLLNEIVNGMQDAKKFIPFAVCPEGTGNGTATSMGIRTTYDAAESLVGGSFQPFDLLNVVQNGEPLCVAHLSVAWGAVADHDYYAEKKYRWMGAFRNLLAPVLVIGLGKSYKGRIKMEIAAESDAKWARKGGRGNTKTHEHKSRASVEKEAGVEWHVIEDHFYIVHACNNSHMASDAIFVPGAAHDDGLLHVLVLRGRLTRVQLLKMFLGSDSGAHIDHDAVEIYACRQLKIEPADTTGHIAVDGELYPCINTEARVRAAGFTVMTTKGNSK